MNKKLVILAALIFGAVGLFLAQGTVKAQDATDNSAMAADNSAIANTDTGAAMNADAPAADAPAAPAAQ